MCNLSAGIEEKGIIKGRKEGRKEGSYINTVRNVNSLMDSLQISQAEACRLLKISIKEYEEAEMYLKKNEKEAVAL